jgi:hypothetical protein
MTYFRVVNPDDVTDEFYVTCDRDDFDLDLVKEHLGLQMYWVAECSKEEYETMTDDTNDYIINVGQSRDELTPHASAYTETEGIEKAKELLKDWKCAEVVYMPVDNVDINKIVWSYYS